MSESLKQAYNDLGNNFLSMFDDFEENGSDGENRQMIVPPPPPSSSKSGNARKKLTLEKVKFRNPSVIKIHTPTDPSSSSDEDGEFTKLNGRSLEGSEKEMLPNSYRERRKLKRKRHLDLEEQQRIAKKRKVESRMKKVPKDVVQRRMIHRDIISYVKRGNINPDDIINATQPNKKEVPNYKKQQEEFRKRKKEREIQRTVDLETGMYEKKKKNGKKGTKRRPSNSNSSFTFSYRRRFRGGGGKRRNPGIRQLTEQDMRKIHKGTL